MKRHVGVFWAMALAAMSVQAEMRLSEAPLSDAELATLRGGFVLDGLEIAIGLEQVVAVNGETQVINHLRIPNLNQRLGSDGLSLQMESLVAQSIGSDGIRLTTGAVGNGGWMTVLQNSLDSATIQQNRQLDIELNNIGNVYRLPRDAGLPMLP
ncbi:hypothetical protein LG325_03615 [Marinobacter nauticus]